MDKKYINFEVESVNIEDKKVDSQFAYAKILAFTSGINRNDLYCSPETLRKTAKSIENCPILYNFSGSPWGNWDVGTHTTPDKSLICGFIEPGTIEFEELDDGRLALSVYGRVWKKYSKKIMDIFSRNSTKKTSVEMEMSDSCEMIDNPKITEMLDFEYFGVCILGDNIEEAVPDSNMEMISFSSQNEEYKKAYAEEFSSKQKYNSRYSNIDFSIPQKVKKNASQGLDIAKSGNISSSSVYMAIGRHLVTSEKISIDKVKFINKKIKSKVNFEEGTSEHLNFMLMGGKDSVNWAKEISDKIDELDSKDMSYFSEDGSSDTGNENGEVYMNLDKETDDNESDKEKNEVNNSMDEIMSEKKVEDEVMSVEKTDNTEDVSMEKNIDTEMSVDSKKDEEVETPEEENSESPAEEKAEDDKKVEKKMSLDSYLDVTAVLQMLIDQTVDNQILVDEYNSGCLSDETFSKAMFTSMCNMSENLKNSTSENMSLKEENMALKEFKAKVEKETFDSQVENFMQEFSTVLPKEEFAKVKEDSVNFSLDTLDAWKNKVKAEAYTFSVGKKQKKPDFVTIGFPFPTTEKSTNGGNGSPWKRITNS